MIVEVGPNKAHAALMNLTCSTPGYLLPGATTETRLRFPPQKRFNPPSYSASYQVYLSFFALRAGIGMLLTIVVNYAHVARACMCPRFTC